MSPVQLKCLENVRNATLALTTQGASSRRLFSNHVSIRQRIFSSALITNASQQPSHSQTQTVVDASDHLSLLSAAAVSFIAFCLVFLSGALFCSSGRKSGLEGRIKAPEEEIHAAMCFRARCR
jgi:hypothetical protein